MASQGTVGDGRYALLFKAHSWDGFATRQLARAVAAAPSADVWVVTDDTRGPVGPVPHPLVFRVTEAMALARGYAGGTTGASLFWYCTDYLHAMFQEAHPGYAHYVAVEHDVGVDVDLDAMVSRMAAEGIDYVGTPLRTPAEDWPWRRRHLAVYPAADLRTDLYCLSAFSRRAVESLRARRLAMSVAFARGDVAYWPSGEAFVPTEVALAGLRTETLGAFADLSRYDWWPPVHEDDLAALPRGAVAHPVLTGAAYVRSALRSEPRPLDILRPSSALRRRLSRCRRRDWVPLAWPWLRARVRDAARRRLEAAGLARHWASGAEPPLTRPRGDRGPPGVRGVLVAVAGGLSASLGAALPREGERERA